MAGWKLLEMVVLLFIVTKNGMIVIVKLYIYIIIILELLSISVYTLGTVLMLFYIDQQLMVFCMGLIKLTTLHLRVVCCR